MANITVIGLGHMGQPMASNLQRAGHHVVGFDIAAASRQAFQVAGGTVVNDLRSALADAEYVVSMVNTGKHVRAVYEGEEGVIALAPKSAMLIDCSTIDVETARQVAKQAEAAGLSMVDAPVSGGVMGAEAGTLTFMVGGSAADFGRASPVLEGMGKKIVHAGRSGNGQAAKICNNMMTGINVVCVSEAFTLSRKLGLDDQTFFDIASTSSGQSWALTTYCPVPGPVPIAPSCRNYEPGFAAELMLKDMRLSQEAATAVGAATPLGGHATSLYQMLVNNGYARKDCSIVAKLLHGDLGLPAQS